MTEVVIAVEAKIGIGEARQLWRDADFVTGMPESQWRSLDRMLENSNLLVTARHEGRLVGLARCLTDFVDLCALADLLVARQWQHQGIGRRLIDKVRHASHPTGLMVLSNPDARGFYERLGLTLRNDAYGLPVREPQVR